MKRILNIIYNIGLVLIHFVGIILFEACCMSLIIDHYQYYSPYFIVVPLILGLLLFHYLLLFYVFTHGILYSATNKALVMQDTLTLLAVSLFLIIPNGVLGTPMIREYAFIICVHMLMVWIRLLSVNYIRKRSSN